MTSPVLYCRGEYDYELFLRYDLYTAKHTQWFYFRVDNTRANRTYRFTIVNFMKVTSTTTQYYDHTARFFFRCSQTVCIIRGCVRSCTASDWRRMRRLVGVGAEVTSSITGTTSSKHLCLPLVVFAVSFHNAERKRLVLGISL